MKTLNEITFDVEQDDEWMDEVVVEIAKLSKIATREATSEGDYEANAREVASLIQALDRDTADAVLFGAIYSLAGMHEAISTPEKMLAFVQGIMAQR
jgi:diphthamide synthase (EF-2-diphthine--ammonia ligase)